MVFAIFSTPLARSAPSIRKINFNFVNCNYRSFLSIFQGFINKFGKVFVRTLAIIHYKYHRLSRHLFEPLFCTKIFFYNIVIVLCICISKCHYKKNDR